MLWTPLRSVGIVLLVLALGAASLLSTGGIVPLILLLFFVCLPLSIPALIGRAVRWAASPELSADGVPSRSSIAVALNALPLVGAVGWILLAALESSSRQGQSPLSLFAALFILFGLSVGAGYGYAGSYRRLVLAVVLTTIPVDVIVFSDLSAFIEGYGADIRIPPAALKIAGVYTIVGIATAMDVHRRP